MRYERKTIREILRDGYTGRPEEIVGVPRGVVTPSPIVTLFYLDSLVAGEDRKSGELPSVRFLRASYIADTNFSEEEALFAQSAIRTASETGLSLVVRGSLRLSPSGGWEKLTFVVREFVFKDNHVYIGKVGGRQND